MADAGEAEGGKGVPVFTCPRSFARWTETSLGWQVRIYRPGQPKLSVIEGDVDLPTWHIPMFDMSGFPSTFGLYKYKIFFVPKKIFVFLQII